MKNVLKHGAMLQVIEKRVIGQHGHNTHVAWRWWQYQDYVVLLTRFVSSESFTWNCAIIILFYLYVRTVITYADWKWKIDYNSKLSNTYQSYLDLNYRQYPTLAELSARIVICDHMYATVLFTIAMYSLNKISLVSTFIQHSCISSLGK